MGDAEGGVEHRVADGDGAEVFGVGDFWGGGEDGGVADGLGREVGFCVAGEEGAGAAFFFDGVGLSGEGEGGGGPEDEGGDQKGEHCDTFFGLSHAKIENEK